MIGKAKQFLKTTDGERAISNDDSETSESEFLDDAVPGPGYYHSEKWTTSLKQTSKPKLLQFFGVRSRRF